jgi:hypothetical protein
MSGEDQTFGNPADSAAFWCGEDQTGKRVERGGALRLFLL